MAGRWHYSLTLPSGEKITANHDDPIVAAFRRVWAGQDELSDHQVILAWTADNRQQIEACREGRCDHRVY